MEDHLAAQAVVEVSRKNLIVVDINFRDRLKESMVYGYNALTDEEKCGYVNHQFDLNRESGNIAVNQDNEFIYREGINLFTNYILDLLQKIIKKRKSNTFSF